MAAAAPVRTNFHPSKKHSDIERWICVYPAYINSKKTRQEGRRLKKELCVENPTYLEIRDVLSVTNIRVGLENKQYCREKSKELHARGRVRLQMRNDDGSFCDAKLASREAIMLYIASKIPLLKSRQNKSNDAQQMPQTQAQPSAGTGKKNKGKRR